MLSQKINRRDAETPSFFKPKIKWMLFSFSRRLGVSAVFIFIFLTSCQTPPTDMRSLVPGEAIVYLETNDLGETLSVLTENPAWESGAAEKTDFSQLKNIQAAAAVTSFEAAETQVTNESSVLNFKPHFVAVADTHQWNRTAASIIENQIGRFAGETYDGDVKLEKSEKNGAEIFVWSSADGRKLLAAASKGVIYLSNDESLLEKSLAVQRGEAESLLKNENLARAIEQKDEKNLAFGYVSPAGVVQIANLLGVYAATNASEEGAIRSFIAKNLPEILNKSAKEITWTTHKSGQGIEDKIFVKTDAEVSAVFRETLVPASGSQFQAAQFLPQQFESVTRYNLQNPQLAWRSVLLVVSKQMDAVSANLLIQAANAFFAPYGISDGELFLSAVGSEIVTARFDRDAGKSVVIAEVKDWEKVKKSISGEINFKAKPETESGAEIWQSEDKMTAAAFVENKIILGDRESVLNALAAKQSGKSFAKTLQFQDMTDNNSLVITITKDAETPRKIIEILGKSKENRDVYTSYYTTRTKFTGNGFERRAISDFGLLGTIVEKFGGSEN